MKRRTSSTPSPLGQWLPSPAQLDELFIESIRGRSNAVKRALKNDIIGARDGSKAAMDRIANTLHRREHALPNCSVKELACSPLNQRWRVTFTCGHVQWRYRKPHPNHTIACARCAAAVHPECEACRLAAIEER